MFTWQGAVLASTVVSLPLVFKAARSAFEGVDPNLERAARTLGLSEVGVFSRVSLPLAWRGIMAGTMLAFARAMGEFGAVSVVSGHIRGATNTIPLHVEILYNEYNFAATFAVASLLALLALVTLAIKSLVQWKLKEQL